MAFKPLQETKRCFLLEAIANSVWERIVKAHRVGMDLKEIGVTADIIVDILNYNIDEISNFEIYAKPGWNEEKFGSDMDFFVEVMPNAFRWFALQAKILKKNNRYTNLRHNTNGMEQWEQLAILEAFSGCKGYYLLYNGSATSSYILNDDCKGAFTGSQYGCSLVEPRDIKRFAELKTSRGNFKNPTFEDIHLKHAKPWRLLTCCKHDVNNFATYTLDQILESDPQFIPVNEINEDEDDNIRRRDVPAFRDTNNAITILANQAKWNPGSRFIVRQTQTLS